MFSSGGSIVVAKFSFPSPLSFSRVLLHLTAAIWLTIQSQWRIVVVVVAVLVVVWHNPDKRRIQSKLAGRESVFVLSGKETKKKKKK